VRLLDEKKKKGNQQKEQVTDFVVTKGHLKGKKVTADSYVGVKSTPARNRRALLLAGESSFTTKR